MTTNGEDNVRVEAMPLEIVWRNPLALVRAHLRVHESDSPYYRWAEQAGKIRARRANWNVNHYWAA